MRKNVPQLSTLFDRVSIMSKRLVLCSDTHEMHSRLTWTEGDNLVHAEDFTMIGRPEKNEEFRNWLRGYPFNTVIIIAGNHNSYFRGYWLVPTCYIFLCNYPCGPYTHKHLALSAISFSVKFCNFFSHIALRYFSCKFEKLSLFAMLYSCSAIDYDIGKRRCLIIYANTYSIVALNISCFN